MKDEKPRDLVIALRGWEIAPWIERFAKMLPDRQVLALDQVTDPDRIAYAISWKHPPGSLTRFARLKAVFSLGAGVDHILSDPKLPDVPVLRIVDPDLTGRMSEYIVLHCLMHLRQQRLYDRQQRDHVWGDDRFQPAAGAIRVGIMGMGELGQDAARKLMAIGFQVQGWGRSAKNRAGISMHHGAAGLTDFLAMTDILVVLLPLTPQTHGLINRALLQGLARDGALGGPVLINAGRGGLQVEADILACLADGSLKAATLDVFETEPLPSSSLLWDHPAVTVTPHNAAMSEPAAICRQIADQIRAHERGEPFVNRVERGRGY
jgi:glyoxylate/hydroxypyruvate reductase